MKMIKCALLCALALCVLLVGCSLLPDDVGAAPRAETELDGMSVSFIDVGQGDGILIQSPGFNMLVDAGVPGGDKRLLSYLSERGVTRLDYLVATHPHADHIGGMASVIREMEDISVILAPDAVATTKTFEKFLDAVEDMGYTIKTPEAGETFMAGGAEFQVLAPNSEEYSDLNNYSIVLRVKYGDVSFLLTGDAESLSEREQLGAGRELASDVMKIGHHGSHSSTSEEYLLAVNPEIAVISCAAGNDYGHPHKETLSLLEKYQIGTYFTYKDGTVVVSTDGSAIFVYTLDAPVTKN